MSDVTAAKLQAYCERIGYAGDRTPGLATLTALQQAQMASIPFDNLDIFLGTPVSLAPADLHDKLVVRRRGGCCFELTLLLADVLTALGFKVAPLAARILLGAGQPRARTHMALQVELPEGPYLVDVGFAGPGPVAPVPLQAGPMMPQGGDGFQVRLQGSRRILAAALQPAWWQILPFAWPQIVPTTPVDLIELAGDPQERADFEMACHYVSTHPKLLAGQGLAAQIVLKGERLLLRNRWLFRIGASEIQTSCLETPAHLQHCLAEGFGLDVAVSDLTSRLNWAD